MLRIRLLQSWFYLRDKAMEEALYEITPMRQFVRLCGTIYDGHAQHPTCSPSKAAASPLVAVMPDGVMLPSIKGLNEVVAGLMRCSP